MFSAGSKGAFFSSSNVMFSLKLAKRHAEKQTNSERKTYHCLDFNFVQTFGLLWTSNALQNLLSVTQPYIYTTEHRCPIENLIKSNDEY